MRFGRVVAVMLPLALSSPALAFVTPRSGARPDLEVASGAPVRPLRTVLWDAAPQSTDAAWRRFKTINGAGWHATFDRHTAVPSRIWGQGIPAPGSMISPAVAESFARYVLAEHIDLLAPGASPDDFVLAADVVEDGMRTLGFEQYHAGVRVIGGQVSFDFKNDRLFVIGSEALPRVTDPPAGRRVSDDLARAAAEAWAAADGNTQARAGAVEGPYLLPLVRDDGTAFAYVVAVDVRGFELHDVVYVGALDGKAVARRSLLRWATGTGYYNAPERWFGGTRMDYPADHAALTIDGVAVETDDFGSVTWGTAAGATTSTVHGSFVNVLNDQGPEITASFTLTDGGSFTWNRASVEFDDAQITTFVQTNVIKDWARNVAPTMTWLDSQETATVNINDVCNAFSDGDAINFFASGSGCENTGRLSDVVHHEFGHSFHAHAIIPGVGDFGDGSLGEGIGDYTAATWANDAGMGRGFFGDDTPLRDCAPDRVWPDDINPDIHETGLIYCGAMWDLRNNLIASMGATDGVAWTDHLHYMGISRAVDIPSTYTEVLAADDDNGNLMDGTPHMCDINAAFGPHGLAPAGVEGGPGVQTPILTGLDVHLPVITSVTCPGANVVSAQLAWRLREDVATAGTIDMTPVADGYDATVPAQTPGQVVQYQVVVTLGSGAVITFPDNPADPRYETFVGTVIPLYCTDFEGTAAPDGWMHGLDSGTAGPGADDWMWGPPIAPASSGDPAQAYSGSAVYGNDLGGTDASGNQYNGQYQSSKVNHLLSPTIDTMGYANVRLQYRRWLGVEDGTYDHATIYGNDTALWSNLVTPSGSTQHVDKEWRFQDVDLSSAVQQGQIAVKFEINSDQGLEFGGWTIDDFCVVAYETGPAVCGNGFLEDGEECDDGNTIDGDGCQADCTTTPAAGSCGDGTVDTGEECDDGNQVDDDECHNDCTLPDTNMNGDGSGGCGCRTSGGEGGAGGLAGGALLALAALVVRRRRGR